MKQWLAILLIAPLLSVLCYGLTGCRGGYQIRNEDLEDRPPLTAPDLPIE